MYEKILNLQNWLLIKGYIKNAKKCSNLIKLATPIISPQPISHLEIGPNQELVPGKSLNPGIKYIYILKLENILDGEQVVSKKTGEPIYNWYVGKTLNPITRWIQHEVGNLYLSDKAYLKLISTATMPITRNMLLSFLEINWEDKSLYSITPASKGVPNSFLNPRNTINSLMRWGEEFFSGTCGANWTSKHKPIEMVWLEAYPDDADLLLKERDVTRDLINIYGGDHVRGGPWCRVGASNQKAEYMSAIAPDHEGSMRADTEDNNKEIIDYLKDVSYDEKDVLDATWWKKDKMIKRIKKDMKSMGFPEERKKTLLEMIPDVLMQMDGDIAATAAALNLSYDNLYGKIKDLNMYEGTADYRRTREKLYSLLLKHDGNLDKVGLELFGMKVWSAGKKIVALLLEHNIEVPLGQDDNEAKWSYFFDKYGLTYLKDMLEKHDGVVAEVAKELDVKPNFLYSTLRKANIL